MKKQYNLEILTPCFCAGAVQNEPEIRVPSIRGQLRWWFRVLGGTRKQEQQVFGGVGKKNTRASKVVIRVPREQWKTGREQLSKNTAFFTRGSRDSASRQAILPGEEFTMLVTFRGKLGGPEEELFLKALEAFCRLGAIGLRTSRGCGALSDEDRVLTFKEFRHWTRSLSNVEAWYLEKNGSPCFAREQKQKETCEILEGMLTQFREKFGINEKLTDELGGLDPRQSSALKLRPVKTEQGILPVAYYTEEAIDPKYCRNEIRSRLPGFSFRYPKDDGPTYSVSSM